MSSNKNLFMGIVALSLSPMVLANHALTDTWASGVYIGLQGGYGMTNWDSMEGLLNNILNDSLHDEFNFNYVINYNIVDVNAFASRISVGYDFHKNFAIEVGYSNFFNKPSLVLTWEGTKKQSPLFKNTWVADLMGIIKADVVNNFGLFAKLGVNYLQTNIYYHDFENSNAKNFNVAYGAGAYYNITNHVSIDASWMRYNGCQLVTDDYQPYSDLFLIGVKYKFNS